MNRRALITGCEGFVGNVLWDRLADKGWDLVGSYHAPPVTPRSLEHHCDISDVTQVRDLLDWTGQVTHVFHLAAISFVPDSIRDPRKTFEINLQGTVSLLETLREKSPGARFVFIGSGDIYGPPAYLPEDEEHPINPQNPYAISKEAAERFCRFTYRAHNQDVVCLRAFNHSGPGQSPDFVLSSFARQIALMEAGKTEPVLRVGNLEAARDFCHVDDVVDAYETAALKGEAGEAYNVCSGNATPLKSIVDKLVARASLPVRVEIDPERLRPVDVPEVRGSHEKLTAATGWLPRKNLDTLLDDLLNYWREEVR